MSTAILIILDGLGVGNAPDAEEYGDLGSDTLGHVAEHVNSLNIPNLVSLGLANLTNISGIHPIESPRGMYGRLQEISAGKDSTTGHWELMGVVTEEPYPTYPDGFPSELLAEFTKRTGYEVIGNRAASGTEIIKQLGDEHLESKKLIVYTSGDSVFQIAAHDTVCPIEELYRVCAIARELLVFPHNISRVIARPFTGQSGNYVRTAYRKDYSIEPPNYMLLPELRNKSVEITSIGKIYDLYNGVGINQSVKSLSNQQGMEKLEQLYLEESRSDRLLLLNLVDFDMLWGHRNDPDGMAKGLEDFDLWLGSFLQKLKKNDLLLMTADHGNDPTMPGTDHSREEVPLVGYYSGQEKGFNIGTRIGFMDVAATLNDFFRTDINVLGKSFLETDTHTITV